MNAPQPDLDTGAAHQADVSRRRVGFLLGLVFVIALLLRVLHWWGQMQHNPFFWHPTMDEEKHHQWAMQIASGVGLGHTPFFRAPLYYGLLGGLYKLIGADIAVARLLGCILGAATCYLIARLGFTLANQTPGIKASYTPKGPVVQLGAATEPTSRSVAVGLIAGLLAAFYWPLVHYDQLLLTPVLELFLNVLLLQLLIAPAFCTRCSAWRWVAAGVVFGLAALARPTILAFAPCIVLWIWLVVRWNARGGLQPATESAAPAGEQTPRLFAKQTARLFTALVLFFLAAAITILPVTLRNRIVGGEWVMIASYGGVNFFIGNNAQADGIAAIVPGTRPSWEGGYEDTHRIPEQVLGRWLTEGQVSDYWFRKGIDWIRSDPAAWLRLTFWKLRLFWTVVEIPNNQPDWFFARLSPISAIYWLSFPLLASLGLAGVVIVARGWQAWLLPLLFLLVTLGTVLIFFCPGRYRLPAIPILMLLTAAGVVQLPALWRARRLKTLLSYAGVAALSALFVLTNPPNRALHERETEGRGHFDLAWVYAQLAEKDPTQRDLAVEHFQRAVQLRPRDFGIRTAYGVWLLKDGKPEAGEQLAAAVAGNPNNAEAQGYYGLYLSGIGQFEKAISRYREAIALNPIWTEPYKFLATALTKLNRNAEAREALETALRVDPFDDAVRLDLGLLLGKQGYYAAAREQLATVVSRHPTNASALLSLGSALGYLEQWSDAAERYRQVLDLEPGSVPALQGLVFVLKRMGQPAAAANELGRLAERCAERHDMEQAVRAAQEAVNIARGAGLPVADVLEARLGAYRQTASAGPASRP